MGVQSQRVFVDYRTSECIKQLIGVDKIEAALKITRIFKTKALSRLHRLLL